MMNISNNLVTSANYATGRAGNRITGIVLHTMVGNMAGAQARFSDPSSQVSVHYGIGLDGSIRRWVDESNTAWQAGDYQTNLTTIGIEHEDNGNYNDGARTPQMYESSSALIADICKRYNFPADKNHIFLHKNVIDKSRYPGGTACPDGLDTDKLINMATELIGDTMTEKEVKSQFSVVLHRDPKNDGEWQKWVGHAVQEFDDTMAAGPEWRLINDIVKNRYPNDEALVGQLRKQLVDVNASDSEKLAQIKAIIEK